MDTVLIPMSNLSSTATNITVKNFSDTTDDNYSNCTRLHELDLADVFIKMDIGNAEFWGSASIPWMACFIAYCVLFYGALLVLFCIYIGLLFYAAKQAYPLRTLMYLLTTYIFWSTSSCALGVLIIYSVANSSDNESTDNESTDRRLPTVTINLETITFSFFVGIIVVTFFSDAHSMKSDSEITDPQLHFPLRYAVFSTVVIYLLAIIIVLLSIPAGNLVTLIVIILIVFRSLMCITSILLLIVGILFKLHSLPKTKEQLCLLWKGNIILLIIVLTYFLLSCAYFLYTLATVVNSNNSCLEDIQLHRTIWLVFNALLRLCEVSFSIAQFVKAVRLVKKTINDDGKSSKEDRLSSSLMCEAQGQRPTRRSMNYEFSSGADQSPKPVGLGKEICSSDSEGQQIQYPTKKHATGIKNLFHTPNSFDAEVKSQSTSLSPATSRLYRSVDSYQNLDPANLSDNTESLSNILDVTGRVTIIDAQSPVDTKYLAGKIEAEMFDESGGIFHSYNHGVTVIIPPGAIPSGILAELKFGATLISPISFQSNKIPVSAMFWFCMDTKVELKEPIELCLPMIVSGCETDALQFAKGTHSTQLNVDGGQMKDLQHGKFADGEYYGSIEVDHFCYYCIMYNKLKSQDIPCNKYLLIAMKQTQPNLNDKSWNIDICLVPDLRTCAEYLKEQYTCNWEYKELTKFSFQDDCNELDIEIISIDFGSAAKVELLSDMKIKKEDVDFYQYYENNKLEELKCKMDEKQYPPRCKARVIARHKNFFIKPSRKIKVRCTCKEKCSYKKKMPIPCSSSNDDSESAVDSNSGSGSDSDLDLPPQRDVLRSSATSGYRSEDELEQGRLSLRNLILLTSEIEEKWYKLGIALRIPIHVMENFYAKYRKNSMKALNSVYRYWLANGNHLDPTWIKLITGLRKITQYTIASNVEQYINMPQDDDSVFIDTIDDPKDRELKNRVMNYMKPELLDFDTLIPHLNRNHLLTQANMYVVMNRSISSVERANELIYKILPSKGARGFRLFVKCLQEETDHMGHQTLAKLFTLPDQMPETLPLQCEDKGTTVIGLEETGI